MTQTDIAAVTAAVLAAIGTKQPRTTKTKKGKRTKKAKGKLTEAEKAAFRVANDAKTVEAFTKAGYTDVQPRVNVLTYDKFVEAGRKVRKGEKSTRVGPFALFHVSQTDAIETVAAA